jgi:hypothetical protein
MTENNKNMLEEFNIYYLLRNLWVNRKIFIIIIGVFALSSIIYSLVVDEKYEVSAVIKPADATQETTLTDSAPLMGFGVGGYTTYPVINDIMITLKSDTFLEILLEKYINEEIIFEDRLKIFDSEIEDPEERKVMKRYTGLRILRKAFDFNVDSDHNIINMTVVFKDKQIAYQFMNDLIDTLRTYIREQNISNLESDIEFFKDLTSKADDPRIVEVLNKKLSEKIERKFNLSSNVFTVTTKPVVPARRIFPKRSFIVIVSTVIGSFISAAVVSLIPQFKKIISYLIED